MISVPVAGKYEYAIFSHVEGRGTNGGTAPANAWVTRKLNVEQYAKKKRDWARLADNQIELEPGNYYVKAMAYAYNVGHHKLRFRRMDNGGETVITGLNAFSRRNDDNIADIAHLVGIITVETTAKYQLQHIFQHEQAGTGMGGNCDIAKNNDEDELYTAVEIIRFTERNKKVDEEDDSQES